MHSKVTEKRLDTGHHDRAGNGRDVVLQGSAAYRLGEGQYADGHDRVLQDQVGQFACVNAIKVGAHFFDPALGDAKDRQAVVAEKQGPRINIWQRMVEHGVQAFKNGSDYSAQFKGAHCAGQGRGRAIMKSTPSLLSCHALYRYPGYPF